MPPGEGIVVELVEETLLAGGGTARRDRPQRYRAIVNCGKAVRDMEIAIRDEEGQPLPDKAIGKVHARGPSIMHSYFRDEAATDACLDPYGWLETGDMGYVSAVNTHIVGRDKDILNNNGKDTWHTRAHRTGGK